MKFEKLMEVIDMLLDEQVERKLNTRLGFTLKQWNIIEEVLHQENIALQDRCEICEDMIRTTYNGGIGNVDFFGKASQILLKQLQARKKEIEKMLAKLESEEL